MKHNKTVRALTPILFLPLALSVAWSIPDSLYGQQAPVPPGMTSLFDGKTLKGWIDQENDKGSTAGWVVTNGVIASTGAGRGTLYTAADYSHYRLLLTMRHVSGRPDHPAAVLFFCERPKDGKEPLDALGAIQFMIPQGYHWDYRPGHAGGGGPEFKTVAKGTAKAGEWSSVEILVDAAKGTARLAVAQPPGAKAVELLDYKLPVAGKAGPIGLQMHNGGLFDEYKDIMIEIDPKVDDLITTK